METTVVELRDGRSLAWSEMGDPGGVPVLAFHGTPGSRHQVLVDPGPAVATGVRFIAPDRPGYGLSTYDPHRTLAAWAADVTELADHLGVDRFAVLGISGGGPHAAVCAALLPHRVRSAAIVSGIAPIGDPVSEEGMMRPNQVFVRVARRLPRANVVPFGITAVLGRRFPDRVMAEAAKRAPKPDAAAFAEPEMAAAFRRDLAQASRTTGRAAAQDFKLFARDWGFRLEDIRVPVQIWQAEADVNVPPAHATRQAAAIPGAVLHLIPDEGHLMAVGHMEEILRELVAAGS